MPDPREQAEAVARWCGWKRIGNGYFVNPAGKFSFWEKPPDYAASLDAMREVEDEIERRGLWLEYAHVLEGIVTHSGPTMEWKSQWLGWVYMGARATALQRLQAAARVIEEVEP